jgi:hypothetical protein
MINALGDIVRRRSGVDQRKVYSEASSNIRGVDAARSMGQVYEPSLQEKAQVALEGRWGFYLEMTNFVLSMFIFSIYIAEVGQSLVPLSSKVIGTGLTWLCDNFIAI